MIFDSSYIREEDPYIKKIKENQERNRQRRLDRKKKLKNDENRKRLVEAIEQRKNRYHNPMNPMLVYKDKKPCAAIQDEDRVFLTFVKRPLHRIKTLVLKNR